MAKRVIKPTRVTPITINGEQMFLKYNMYAIEKLSELGIDITKLNEKTVDLKTITSILWAGLLTYDHTLTRDEVAMMVDVDEAQYIANKITEAINSKKEIEPKN